MAPRYAPLRLRLLAQVFNLLLLMACVSPLAYLFNHFLQPSVHDQLLYALFNMIRSLLFYALVVVSMAWFTHRFGGSPGKCLLDLKVLSEKDGGYLTLAQAITRSLVATVSVASVFGVLFMWFDPHRRTLHDRVMHTIVVEQEDNYADIEVDETVLTELAHDGRA